MVSRAAATRCCRMARTSAPSKKELGSADERARTEAASGSPAAPLSRTDPAADPDDAPDPDVEAAPRPRPGFRSSRWRSTARSRGALALAAERKSAGRGSAGTGSAGTGWWEVAEGRDPADERLGEESPVADGGASDDPWYWRYEDAGKDVDEDGSGGDADGPPPAAAAAAGEAAAAAAAA